MAFNSGRLPIRTTGTILATALFLGACSSLDGPELLQTAASGSVTERIDSGRDDVEEVADGAMYAPSKNLEIVETSRRGVQLLGLRFDDIDVPQGATITKAYVQFTAARTSSGKVRASVRGIDGDDAPTFSGRRHYLSSRKKTSEGVSWNVSPWRAGASGSAQRTPDLSDVVQEIVDRPGWESGNALALAVEGSRGDRSAKSYEASRKSAPLLRIEYKTSRPGDKPTEEYKNPGRGVGIIFDTDFGFDVDDVGALAVLNALADNGEAKILAAMTPVTDVYAPRAMDAVNTFYGRPGVPLGQNRDAPSRYRWDNAHPYWRNPSTRFIANLTKEFPNDAGTRVATAVSLYRKTLASRPDRSVKIVLVGFHKNLADLLESGPDGYSSLSGKELVKRKVRQLVVMGGSYPSSDRDFNLNSGPGKDASDAQRVISDWPGEIVFTPGDVCGDVSTGQTLRDTRDNPVARAYQVFFGRSGAGRSSWDLCSVLYAVRGEGSYFRTETGERLKLDDNGRNVWVRGSGHKRLVRVTSSSNMRNVIEKLLTQAPK